MKKYLLFSLLIALPSTYASAQLPQQANGQALAHAQVHDSDEYAVDPYWIDMMEDTLTNFHEAEKAYRIYFQHHEKPEGEEVEINEHAEREEHVSKRRQRKIDAENNLRMDVKRYEVWREQMLPYVQNDGRILTPEERLAIWKEQNESE